MGAKIDNVQTEEEYKRVVKLKIATLKALKCQFEQFYEITGEDVYKRQIWRIEQKIKNLEELL
jgi:hypothetical protein